MVVLLMNSVPAVPLAESWINPALPTAFRDHVGRGGRLIGRVDDPVSSCLSCHSTAEIDMSKVGDHNTIFGAASKPLGCADPSVPMAWFRNLPSGTGGATAFGHALACPVNTTTAGLTALDYSLQISVGVSSVFGFQNPNPCATAAQQLRQSQGAEELPSPPAGGGGMRAEHAKFAFRKRSTLEAARLRIDERQAGMGERSPVVPDPSEAQRR